MYQFHNVCISNRMLILHLMALLCLFFIIILFHSTSVRLQQTTTKKIMHNAIKCNDTKKYSY